MAEHDLEKLLGGFAADTLTPEERRQLFAAAMQDQQLFDALADEQALKELLTDPAVRRRLLHALNQTSPSTAGSTGSWLDWFRRPAGLAWAGGLAAAVFAVVLGTKVYQDSLKQAAQSVATEESKPSAPASQAPAPSQHASPSLAEPTLQATQNTAPAKNLAKKDSVFDKMADKERTAPLVSQEPNAQDVTRDRRRPETDEDRLQAGVQPAKRAKSSERTSTVEDTHPSAGTAPLATTPMAAPLQAPAATEALAPTISARALFYGEAPAQPDPGMATDEKERAMQPPAESAPQAARPRLKLEQFSKLGQATGPVQAAKLLGLRYSFITRGIDGQTRERATAKALQDGESAHLAVEANQDAYLQIWQLSGSSKPRLLLPQQETGQISTRISAGIRQLIPLPADVGSVTLIARLSRAPFGPISRQEAAMLDRNAPNQVREFVTTTRPEGSQEQATYIVSQDPSPTAQITIDILPAQQQ